MASLDDAFHAAAVELEEDLRKIDAGEVPASPFKRALIAGAIRTWKHPDRCEPGRETATDDATEAKA